MIDGISAFGLLLFLCMWCMIQASRNNRKVIYNGTFYDPQLQLAFDGDVDIQDTKLCIDNNTNDNINVSLNLFSRIVNKQNEILTLYESDVRNKSHSNSRDVVNLLYELAELTDTDDLFDNHPGLSDYIFARAY